MSPQISYTVARYVEGCRGDVGVPGYRITARSLESQGLSETVLKEFRDLDAFATLEPEGLNVPGDKVVFVLEEEEAGREGPTARRA